MKDFITNIVRHHLSTDSLEYIDNVNYCLVNSNISKILLLLELDNKNDIEIRKEFFILSEFNYIKTDDVSNILTKIVFLKIGFLSEDFESLSETIDLLKINIETIDIFNHWREAVEKFKKHYNFSLNKDGTFFKVHLDELNFINTYGSTANK